MKRSGTDRICLVPHLSGIGGMVSFQKKLEKGLAARQVAVTHDLTAPDLAAVLVIGGVKDVAGLWRARQRGIPVVQRLDGMNWLHRLRRTGWKHYLRAEYGNALLSLIRARLATRIVYQSEFSRRWWERERGPTRIPNQVIYNGVDLEQYTPNGNVAPPGRLRLLLVEGTIGGGYEIGLETAAALADALHARHQLEVALEVVGGISPALVAEWQARSQTPIHFHGKVPPERIPAIDRSAHVLYSADLNAACPNSVIEALACGLPVVSFDTGALPELVKGDAGRIVPYGGDPWQIDPPDVPALAAAAAEILRDQGRFRPAARTRAEAAFGLDAMVTAYLEALLGPA